MARLVTCSRLVPIATDDKRRHDSAQANPAKKRASPLLAMNGCIGSASQEQRCYGERKVLPDTSLGKLQLRAIQLAIYQAALQVAAMIPFGFGHLNDASGGTRAHRFIAG
jgi:hypothetical protein